MIVADTDVLIDFLQGKEPGFSAVTAALASGDLATTVVSRYEVLAGARGAGERDRMVEFLGTLPAISLGPVEADRAAAVASSLSARGQGIGAADSLIAGTVLVHDASLLTRNLGHFGRVEGLRMEPLGG